MYWTVTADGTGTGTVIGTLAGTGKTGNGMGWVLALSLEMEQTQVHQSKQSSALAKSLEQGPEWERNLCGQPSQIRC